VSEPLLREQRTGPAAEDREQMQDGFRNAPVAALRPRLVHRVNDKREAAHHRVHDQQRQGDVPAPDAQRDCGKEGTSPGEGQRLSRPKQSATFETRAHRPRTLPFIKAKIVSDGVTLDRPGRTFRQRMNVQKDITTSGVGRDEAESLLIIPRLELATVIHRFSRNPTTPSVPLTSPPSFRRLGTSASAPSAYTSRHERGS
jgi:hypothetical protein